MRNDNATKRSEVNPFYPRDEGIEQVSSLPDLSVFHYQYRNDQRESWHAHPQGQLIYAERGVLRVTTPGQNWTLAPMAALWLPANLPHEFHAVGDMAMYSLYLTPALSQIFWPQERVFEVTPLLHQLILRLAEQPESGNLRESLVNLTFNEMRTAPQLLRCGLPLPRDRRLLVICEQLILTPENNFTLSFWGDRVGASARTLARLFISETGLSFVQWRQQLRLAEAITLLAQGIPVRTIANELGYQSVSAFVTMFKKYLGNTPQRYLHP